jgi:hypothetical protein
MVIITIVIIAIIEIIEIKKFWSYRLTKVVYGVGYWV